VHCSPVGSTTVCGGCHCLVILLQTMLGQEVREGRRGVVYIQKPATYPGVQYGPLLPCCVKTNVKMQTDSSAFLNKRNSNIAPCTYTKLPTRNFISLMFPLILDCIQVSLEMPTMTPGYSLLEQV